jgi:hypothetical protein
VRSQAEARLDRRKKTAGRSRRFFPDLACRLRADRIVVVMLGRDDRDHTGEDEYADNDAERADAGEVIRFRDRRRRTAGGRRSNGGSRTEEQPGGGQNGKRLTNNHLMPFR